MANRKQKTISRSTGEWMYVSFQAHPEEVSRWRELANVDDRSLSYWIRNVLNAAIAAKGDSHEKLPLETLSSDRA